MPGPPQGAVSPSPFSPAPGSPIKSPPFPTAVGCPERSSVPGPSPDLLGRGPQPCSCVSPPILDPSPYLCSSGDWLGDAHLNPAPCGRERAVSGGHRPGAHPPPATAEMGTIRSIRTPPNPRRASCQTGTEPAPRCTHCPAAPPPKPSGHNEAFIGAQSHPHICSTLTPHFDVSPCRTPPHATPRSRGAPGTEGPCCGHKVGFFHAKLSPPRPRQCPCCGGCGGVGGRRDRPGIAGPSPRGRR